MPSEPIPTVRQLRRRWKPHKERLNARPGESATVIRFHRCCSWLQRAEELEGDTRALDDLLLARWVAFNALYGQWDQAAGYPLPDRQTYRAFLDRILAMDRDGVLAAMLHANKKLVMALLDDSFLGKHYWRAPDPAKAHRTTPEKHRAASAYVENNWSFILEMVVDRVYFLRGQLVHGASTYDGKLNRTAVRRAGIMMAHLVPAVLTVWTDRGADEDWGPMCYPPQQP